MNLNAFFRALLFGFCLYLFPQQVRAQESDEGLAAISRLTRTVRSTGSSLPQEKVYLHLDNTCYFLGDTIWYKAYVVRSDRQVPTDLSKILYVELLTPDGYLVERQQVPLENDTTGYGNFALADSLYGGYYELRAYTRWMLNWGRRPVELNRSQRYMYANAFYNAGMLDEFFTDYDKLYSRVFPVYDRPSEPGVYDRNMTMRPMRRYYRSSKEKPEPVLTFFPEGGELVAGLPCRLAYELTDRDGRRIDLEVIFRDGAGTELVRSRPLHRGRGVAVLPPLRAGARYEAEVRYDGRTHTFRLPEVCGQGCALQVDAGADSIRVRLSASGLSDGTPLGLHVLHSGQMVADTVWTVHEGDAPAAFAFAARALPAGVNQLTVFDARGRVFADRLFFVRPAGLDLQPSDQGLQIEGLQPEYAPFAPVELTLSAPGLSVPAHLSLAVRDASGSEATYDSGTLLTELLLASELKGFVEQPEYYFEADDSLHRAALDHLLLVQGWRRWRWEDLSGMSDFQLRYLPEKYQTLAGAVYPFYKLDGNRNYDRTDILKRYAELKQTDAEKAEKYYRRNYPTLDHEVLLRADYVQDTFLVESAQPTQNGYFYLPTPRFFGQSILFLSATDRIDTVEVAQKKKGFVRRMLDKLDNRFDNYGDELAWPDYYVKLDRFFPHWPAPYTYYQTASPDDPFDRIFLASDSLADHVLPTVTVRSRRGGLRKLDRSKPAFVVDARDAFNHLVDLGMNTGRFGFDGVYRSTHADAMTSTRQNNSDAEMTGKIADHSAPDTNMLATCPYGDCLYEGVRGFVPNLTVLSYIGDMGVDNSDYFIQVRYDGKAINGKPDNVYILKDGSMFDPEFGGKEEIKRFRTLAYIDKLYFYTDYCPRERGDWKYEQSNIPDVVMDIRRYPEGLRRQTYRDRNLLIDGFAICDEFYHPDYSKRPLPEVKDYRRTLYWNPDLRLAPGETRTIKFYNNGKSTLLQYDAEGLGTDGTVLVGKNR